jgi:ABC-type multidrug transport system fused ATPase/permease subunit
MFVEAADNKWKHIAGLFFRRKWKTALLILLILISIGLESVGFAMILPVLERAIGVDSVTNLGFGFAKIFSYIGIEDSLQNVTAIFVFVIFIKGVVAVVCEAYKTYYSNSYKREVTLAINKAMLYMDYAEFQSLRQGQLISDSITATVQATSFLVQSIEFFASIVAIIFFVIVLFIANPGITLVASFFGFLFYVLSKRVLGKYSTRVGVIEVSVNRSATDDLAESVTLMRDFRLNSLEEYQLSRMRSNLNRIVDLEVKWSAITASLHPLIEIMLAGLLGGFIIFLSTDGRSSTFLENAPTLGLVAILSQRIFSRASQITRTHVSIVRSLVPFLAVSKYLDYPISRTNGIESVNCLADVHFCNIDVKAGDLYVLKELSIVIPGGRVTGIIGETGSGKSTLIDLLLRLRYCNYGDIFIGNVNINDIDIKVLRNKIAVVSQSMALRNTSILDNIRMGNLHASDQDIFRVSRALGLDQFIESLPDGYQTIVGDRGGMVSGGQMQRILLARALLKSPDILVLDEYTSALDADTEESINSKVMELMSGKTVVVITHRPSVLKYCDRIYSLCAGVASIVR